MESNFCQILVEIKNFEDVEKIYIKRDTKIRANAMQPMITGVIYLEKDCTCIS
jgi:hypothetical protein